MRRLDVFFAAQDAAEKGREADADELFALAATAPTTGKIRQHAVLGFAPALDGPVTVWADARTGSEAALGPAAARVFRGSTLTETTVHATQRSIES